MDSRPLLSRRTTLAAGLGTAGLAAATGAGCSARLPGSASPAASTKPGSEGVSPDVQIVVGLVGAMRRSVTLLEDTRAQHPKLAAQVTPLLAVQRRHLAVLRQAAPADSLSAGRSSTPTVPARAARAMDQVLRTTEALRTTCYSSAAAAESGTFARLLAGMGAGLSQRLALAKASR
ncbi:MAG: hypothetical protein ACR2FG_04510 [Marmoricola sp.]